MKNRKNYDAAFLGNDPSCQRNEPWTYRCWTVDRSTQSRTTWSIRHRKTINIGVAKKFDTTHFWHLTSAQSDSSIERLNGLMNRLHIHWDGTEITVVQRHPVSMLNKYFFEHSGQVIGRLKPTLIASITTTV